MNGLKDILDILMVEAEDAKLCLEICNDLKKRNIKETLIACVAGLKGLPQAIKTLFPTINLQICFVH